jgi:VanZ family protein
VIKKFEFIILYWLPPITWSLIIFLFSAHSVPSASRIYWGDFIIKKTAHLLEYGILAILWFRGLKESGLTKGKAAILAVIFSILYGITDEFHQSYTPGREPRIRDVFFDTIGASLAIYYIWNILPKAPKRLKDWAKKLDLL